MASNHYITLPITKEALVPPNPNEFDKTTFISRSTASKGTKFNTDGTGSCKFNVGGAI